jgi:hypothetical protein
VKTFPMWVLVDRKGVVWTYFEGKPVTFDTKAAAAAEATGLDAKREWKATRAVLTVTRESQL